MKHQPYRIFTDNAGDLLPKNNLSKEKINFDFSNDVYYAMQNSKFSRGRGLIEK